MVDVLRNQHEVHQKWENKAYNRQLQLNPQLASSVAINPRVPDRRTYLSKKYLTELNHWNAPFKTTPMDYVATNKTRKKFIGYACSKCAPKSHASLYDDVCKSLGMRNMFHVPQQNPDQSFIVQQFAYLKYALQCKHFKYTEPSIDILSNNRIKEGISKAAEQDCNNIEYHENRARKCFNSMKSSMSSTLLRFTAWFLLKVLGKIFSSIQVHNGQIEVLKKTAKSPKPVVYLPLHRSHLDYILITLVLFLNDIQAPLIAAGDNLRIPVFSRILSGLGGFFIKRKLDNAEGKKDFVYRAILHSYIVESLKLGNSLEFFIEGGRSRTGKVCLPKAGLLSIIMDAYCDGDIEDAYIVPVSVCFEKLVEGNFVAEQLGHKKKKETFFGAISNIWSTFKNSYGNVRIDFGQPFILSEYFESIQSCQTPSPISNDSICPTISKSMIKSPSIMSLYGTDVAKEEHRQLINRVAQHIVYDAGSFSCLMCTNLVAFLLLTQHRDGISKKLLINDFERLCKDLHLKKKNIGFTGKSEDIVEYALNILGENLVSVIKQPKDSLQQAFIKPNVELPSVLELSYYSAPVITSYFTQSVVATAIIICLNADIVSLKGCKSNTKLSQDDILELSLNLCDIMQFEHIFCPPCENLQMLIINTIEEFAAQDILINEENYTEIPDKRKTASIITSLGLENERFEHEYWECAQFTVNLGESSVEKLCFLQNIISPYIESYWLTSVQLYKLLQKEMDEEAFIKSAQKDIFKRLDDGLLVNNESVALESIKNALKLLETWGVVEHCRQDKIKLLYLGENFENSDQISAIVSKFQLFRSLRS